LKAVVLSDFAALKPTHAWPFSAAHIVLSRCNRHKVIPASRLMRRIIPHPDRVGMPEGTPTA